jgi:hypothetical protein
MRRRGGDVIRLDTFRQHCAEMATAQHKPDCPSITAKEPWWDAWTVRCDDKGWPSSMLWRGPKPKWEPPRCDGCVTDDERALFAQMAREVANYQQGNLMEEAS